MDNDPSVLYWPTWGHHAFWDTVIGSWTGTLLKPSQSELILRLTLVTRKRGLLLPKRILGKSCGCHLGIMRNKGMKIKPTHGRK